MSGFIDGVHKVFVLRHEANAMHCDAYLTPADAAIGCLRINWQRDYNYVARLTAFRELIDDELAREALEAADEAKSERAYERR